MSSADSILKELGAVVRETVHYQMPEGAAKATDRIRNRFLQGTTCHGHSEVVWENDTHILMLHRGHTSYVDRCVGSRRCKTWRALYHKAALEIDQNLFYGRGYIKKWEGLSWRAHHLQYAINLAEKDRPEKSPSV